MSWALAETPIRAALAYIATNGAAKLTAVKARYADNVLLPDFVARRMADPMVTSERDFPVLYAIPTRDVPEPGPGGLRRGFIYNGEVVFVAVFEATIDETSSGTETSETLSAMGARYGVAILELLADSISSTGIQWGTGSPIELSYGSQFAIRGRRTRLSDVQVRIGYQRKESAL